MDSTPTTVPPAPIGGIPIGTIMAYAGEFTPANLIEAWT